MTGRARWPLVRLGEILEGIEAGVSVRSDGVRTSNDEPGVLKTSALSGGVFDPSESKRIVDADLHRAAVKPRAGCILMSRMNTLALVGESAYVPRDEQLLFLPDRIWQLHPDRSRVVPHWLSLLLQSDDIRDALRAGASGTSGSMKNITQEQLRGLKLRLPSLDEQARIARAGEHYARLLHVLGSVIESKRAFKRALVRELLTGRRRFPEFANDPFTVMSLGGLATAGAARNRGILDEARVMGVLKNAGMVLMRDHVRAGDLTRYQIVPPDGFAYNPMRLNIGSIARNLTGADCLVSPDYVVFTTNTSALLPAFLDQVRRSHFWSDFVRSVGAGSVRVRIYFRDLAELRLPVPSLAEQNRIAGTLEAADREIAILESMRDVYETQKRALMQILLSGELSLPSRAGTQNITHV